MKTRAPLAVGLVCAITSGMVRAEEPETKAQRARVRLHAGDGGGEYKGALVEWTSQQLTIRTASDRDAVSIPLRQVEGLFISEGRARRKAAIIGSLVGLAVVGAVVLSGASGVGCDPNQTECFCSGEGCLKAFLLGSVPAAAIGASTGALVAPERWREVPIQPRSAPSASLSCGRIRVGIAPVRGGGAGFASPSGLGAAMAVTF
jgi:hypothetical protein